ncbi:butyrophilin-like protein 2 [Caretta caretta]|uniref:butyrophilin-like protein 2 n=1 Tax=Caretta caretta TaxID=8467 RepID=UPI003F4B8283
MKGLSICHSSTASSSLPGFIIFFITFYVHKLESARFTVVGPDHPVAAIVGEDIVLPCHLFPRMSAENMEVRWFRSEFTSFVHLYQHGKDEYGQQMPEYHERTELLKAGIMDGNVALRIVNVRPSDEGQYCCFVQDGIFNEEAVLELKVEASGSAPQISVEGYQDGGIRMVCQLAGWYPEPEVLWRDRNGQLLSPSTETKSQDGRGLFEIKSSIIITENSNQNLSCSVRNAYFSLEKEPSTFYISDFFFPRMSPWLVVWSVTLVISLVFVGLTLFLLKLRGKHLNTISKLQVDLEWRRSLSDVDQVTVQMKVLSSCHSSRASSLLPGFIICFLTCSVHRMGSAKFTVIGPPDPVAAILGQEAVLPCHLSPRMSAANMEVRWFRPEFVSFVHLYRDGKDQYEGQMPEYEGRTELLKAGLTDGNVPLRILNIRPSDEGQYHCFVQDGTFYEETVLELRVAGLGSAPLISVEGHQDGGIRVVCRSAGWYPEPEVLWKDFNGQRLPSLSETKSRGDNNLFETETVLIVTEHSNQNLSCCIRNTVLNQDKESAVYIAVNVTLDPDTAQSQLVLSEDGKSVRWGDTWQNLPDNPERFDSRACVLGCEGFTAETHCWEVEVGDGELWAVGVARESVRRKGWISLSPEQGIWAVGQCGGQFRALTSPEAPLPLSQVPSRIRVCLDCDRWQVTFSDAGDGAPIFTFPPGSIPRERIRPWFWLGVGGSRLSLCP